METLTAKQKQYLEQPKVRISGSEAIVRCLLAEGVEVLYGYPGGAIMPVYDELYKYEGEINHVLTRHEQCASLLTEWTIQLQEIDYTIYDINEALIIDNTGAFRDQEALQRHLIAKGSKNVLLTSKFGSVFIYILG